MKQHYLDERTGISYTLQGDYYLPDLALPTEKEPKPIGIWDSNTYGILSGTERCYTSIC